MYRPQYLEQKYEVITVHKGNGEKVYEYSDVRMISWTRFGRI
ncbi:TPA: hypothetical protein ACY4D2_000502 [Enterococcus faecium]